MEAKEMKISCLPENIPIFGKMACYMVLGGVFYAGIMDEALKLTTRQTK